MVRFVATKVLDAALSVLAVATFVFVVSRLLGDPAALLLPLGAPESDLALLRHQLGLDRSIVVQYLDFLGQLLRGDFGRSFQFMRPAIDVVLERLPATLLLTSTAVLIGTLFGVAIGILSAVYVGTILEPLFMLLVLLGQATPVFWLSLILILYFAVDLGWLPTGGYGTFSHLVLPAITLSVFVSASVARLLRSSIIEVRQEDYVRTARAKGLLPAHVFVVHVLRNALIPVVTMVVILVGELLGGAVITESVFSWPGVGRMLVQAIETKDFPVLQCGIVVVASLFILINMVVELIYGMLDPRIASKR